MCIRDSSRGRPTGSKPRRSDRANPSLQTFHLPLGEENPMNFRTTALFLSLVCFTTIHTAANAESDYRKQIAKQEAIGRYDKACLLYTSSSDFRARFPTNFRPRPTHIVMEDEPRQLPGQDEILWFAPTAIREAQGALSEELSAVSYTHLDVYKRQFYNSLEIAI